MPIAGVVSAALVVIGVLLVPVRKEQDEEGSPLDLWSTQAVSRRLKRRIPFLLAYLGAAGIVLLVWAFTRSLRIAGIAAGAVLLSGALLLPIGREHDEKTGLSLAPWTGPAARRRLKRRRPLLYLYLAAAGIVLVAWVLPPVLTKEPTIPGSADRHTASNAARTGLVALVAAIGAVGGLAYTARTYRLSREGHITDRYSKAVELLGSDKIEARLGGIYALERLMRDSPADQPAITETLAAYVRQHAPRTAPLSTPPTPGDAVAIAGWREWASLTAPGYGDRPGEDVQAILTLLSRRRHVEGENPIILARTQLAGGSLFKAPLVGADLTGARLSKVAFDEATLTDAVLTGADLTGAHLTGATLTGATLVDATMTGAHLTGAILLGANLSGATLTVGALSTEQQAAALNVHEINWVPSAP